ncbi:ABC transporter substrate-binding protein [Devosia sp. 2618]|uniref:ABC transporter substrate-binding protein n=1 Tax=Devosia sp. 2618 TaxID=3156454 RepID=UPI00339230C1
MNKLTALLFAALLAITPASAQETHAITDYTGRVVEVPTKPLRIVSLHDLSITIPLIELGVFPVGSHGRTTTEGTPFIRSSAVLTGVDFANSDITFVGNNPADVEAIAALQPDLVLTTEWQGTPVDQLEKIAPTLLIDSEADMFATYDLLAGITGTEDRLAYLKARYEGQIAQIKRLIDTQSITTSVIQGVEGSVYVLHTYGTLGRVLRDAGFKFPAIIDAIPVGGDLDVPAEQLPELDADFIFATYRTDTLETPADSEAQLNKVVPNFCQYLTACQNNQLITIPREEASSNSFYALGAIAYMVISQISGRDFVPFQSQ